MSELCSSNCHFSSLIISDFILLCSFILSHPLYFSYFIFFSPYLLTLISFLSPLFITTSLLFLAFLIHTHSSQSQTHLTPILKRLQFNKDPTNEEDSDHLGIYEIIFSPPSMAAAAMTEESENEILDQTPPKDQILEPNPLPGPAEEAPTAVAGELINSGENKVLEMPETPAATEEKKMENFLKILDEFERLASNADEKKIIRKKKQVSPSPSPRGAKIDKVVEKKQKSLLINGSEAAAAAASDNDKTQNQTRKLESSPAMAKSQSQRIITGGGGGGDCESLSSYGSMRREREWKRTLACKLFEERHNGAAACGGGGGGEAMDSLWEAYEVESSKNSTKRNEKGRREREREREIEEDDVIGGQLCCLQALKMSAGKMNLGVGRPNLVKISKAIKGIGWLHSLTKNSKKVHNNGDHRF